MLRFRAVLNRRVLMAVLVMACVQPNASRADETDTAQSPGPPPTKLTGAFYAFSSGTHGIDLNLRHAFTSATAWIGLYHQTDQFDQARVGYEYDYHRDWLTFVPSVQAATHGFVGATLYGEVGRRFFGIGGFGRTNLHPYWNLGFDPNDYIQFGAGYHDRTGGTASVSAIRDNRLDTGQTNTHLYVRRPLPDTLRLTIDVVSERGRGDDGSHVSAWAETVDVDWRRWFVRMAQDPRVNYTRERQVRVAAGLRF